jgi:hypothetical protein
MKVSNERGDNAQLAQAVPETVFRLDFRKREMLGLHSLLIVPTTAV